MEQSFEFFAAAVSAYLLMAVGPGVAPAGGARGLFRTHPDLPWRGARHRPPPLLGGSAGHVGSAWLDFSFIEVLPLVLLIMDAIQQRDSLRGTDFKYGLAYTYTIGAAFWNFVGAGVFGGGVLNAPLVNYYEHGTFLTLNHAHTALFGAFGPLGLGRSTSACAIWLASRRASASGWADGVLALQRRARTLDRLQLLSIGWPQLAAVYEHGYAFARSAAFYDTTLFWQWMRLPGDVVFAAGALLMAWDFLVKLRPIYPRFVERRLAASSPSAAPVAP